MKPVVVHDDAKAELDDAVAYYEGREKGLGLDLQQEVESGVLKIRKYPIIFPPHKTSGFRKYFVERFPYTIFFMEMQDAIWVAAIAHGSRRPNYWRNRSFTN